VCRKKVILGEVKICGERLGQVRSGQLRLNYIR
jgi:hypothetical protein